MKKFKWVTLIIAFTLVLSACGGANNAAQPSGGAGSGTGSGTGGGTETGKSEQSKEVIKWKFGHLAAEGHIWQETALKFAELVKEKTEGQIEITVYPNNQLGGETDTINMIKAGTADLVISGETMANWAPKAALMAVPYAFRDTDHLNKVVTGDIGAEVEAEIIEKVGLTPLYYHTRAPRNLTSNKPITSPADLDGFKMRVPNVPLFLSVWEAAGAKPQVMDFNEVFTGIQQGVIDGQENPVDLIHSAGFYEVQDYVNQTEHVHSWIYVLVGNKQFEGLSAELQAAVKEAAAEAQVLGEELFATEIDNYHDILKEEGMEFVEVDQNAFLEAMKPAVKENLTAEQYALYEKILNVK